MATTNPVLSESSDEFSEEEDPAMTILNQEIARKIAEEKQKAEARIKRAKKNANIWADCNPNKTKLNLIPKRFEHDGTLCRDSRAHIMETVMVAVKAEPEPQPEMVTLETTLDCEDEKYSGIGDLKRLSEMLRNKLFYVEADYHYFRKSRDFPLLKVKTQLLLDHPEVFPEGYKPRRQKRSPRGRRGGKLEKQRAKRLKYGDFSEAVSRSSQNQSERKKPDMVVMKKEWMPEIDDPKLKFIASRARLVTLLRKQRFKTKDGYHLFDASGVFPKLRIKSSLIPADFFQPCSNTDFIGPIKDEKKPVSTKRTSLESATGSSGTSAMAIPDEEKYELERYRKLGINLDIKKENGKTIIDYS